MTKIAIPLNNTMGFYHRNPMTAPKFAIYTINMGNKNVTFSLLHILDNPLNGINENGYDQSQIDCNCDRTTCSDIQHKAEHYVILDAIQECKYLLVDYYCENIVFAMESSDIQTYKISPFITQVDTAIKNFLLGASLASTYEQIHHAS
jgi:predicted Fe-Mo cluster-binding NifX family protein